MPALRVSIFLSWLLAAGAGAQTVRMKLSTILPGTENVQLVYNGDFQFQGSEVNGGHPFPTGWSRAGDMFVGPARNMVPRTSGVVAAEMVDGAAPFPWIRRRSISIRTTPLAST